MERNCPGHFALQRVVGWWEGAAWTGWAVSIWTCSSALPVIRVDIESLASLAVSPELQRQVSKALPHTWTEAVES